jgi:hypothetical protein
MRKLTVKLNLLALSLFVSSSAFAHENPYVMKSVPHDVAHLEMTLGSDETNTPEALQGIWWMNGNPLADELVSFASVKWEDIEEDGEVVGYRGSLPVYDAKVWSWHDSDAGSNLYKLVRKTKLVYVAEFNKDFSYGVVTPTFQFGSLNPLEIPPSKFLTFAMRKVSDDEYARESLILGLPSKYRFRRLVDGNGVLNTTTQKEFLSLVEADNALFPVCEADPTPASLPTACVD